MAEFSVTIDRKESHTKSIIGELWVNGNYICKTLELPWRFNEKSVSCVPPGRYDAFLRYDKTDQWRMQLLGTWPRTGVQIHIGNYPEHTQGCVLVGMKSGINKVLKSTDAYKKLKKAFYLTNTDAVGEPVATPNVKISVEFKGILATEWGDSVPNELISHTA